MSKFFLLFRNKVEAAVQLVELLELAEKIKAVELWNVLSEDLQDMVNKSVTDFSSLEIKVEKEMDSDTNESTSLCDADTKENVPLQLLSATEQNDFSDYYVLSAVIDLQKEDDSQVRSVQFMVDHNVSSEDYNTIVSHMGKTDEENQKSDDLDKPMPKLPTRQRSCKRPSKPTNVPAGEPSQEAMKKEGPKLYPRGKKEYGCDMCEKKFRTRSTLHSHRAMHLGTYACKICKKWCSSRGALTSHTRVHTGEKPFQCNVCSKFFRGRHIVRIHMRTHTGERPYECKVCGKTFSQSSGSYGLQEHMDVHLDNRAFTCDICNESFFRKSALNSHRLRIHGKWDEKQKKYKCESCDEFFFSQVQLDNHKRVHIDGTMLKPFICELCKTGFMRQRSLDEHLNIHNGLKPFECKDCQEKYATRNMLNKHRDTYHKPVKSQDIGDKPPKKRKRSKKSKSVNDEDTNSILEASNQPTPIIGSQILAVVMDPETASLQMGNQALLYNPETQETIPAGDTMDSVLDALNQLANSSVENG